MNETLKNLKIKLFADGAEIEVIREMAKNPLIKGFTTNPTLMRKAGLEDYVGFSKKVIEMIPDYPLSLEVFSDDFSEMEIQAKQIASWGKNVFVKIPITNTKGEFCGDLVKRLAFSGIQVNVTAMMTMEQTDRILACLNPEVRSNISIFAGRIADTGIDPLPLMREVMAAVKSNPKCEVIWASPRELLNVFHAESVGCHIITATTDILKKLSLVGKNLEEYSLDTVKMFYNDATSAGYKI